MVHSFIPRLFNLLTLFAICTLSSCWNNHYVEAGQPATFEARAVLSEGKNPTGVRNEFLWGRTVFTLGPPISLAAAEVHHAGDWDGDPAIGYAFPEAISQGLVVLEESSPIGEIALLVNNKIVGAGKGAKEIPPKGIITICKTPKLRPKAIWLIAQARLAASKPGRTGEEQ